jgi:hypothetical protein
VRRWWGWLAGARAKPLREVGGIVLGVLIALAIGEAAEEVRWRFKVAASERAMRAELGTIRRALNERQAAAPCIDARLAEIGAVLAVARGGGRVPALGEVGAPPFRLIETTAFQVARDEGISLHMPRERWRLYAAVYSLLDGFYAQFAGDERTQWELLQLVRDTPGALDGDLLATLLAAWASARGYHRRQTLIGGQIDRTIAALGVPIDWRFDTEAGDPRSLAEQRDAYRRRSAMCRPLAPR